MAKRRREVARPARERKAVRLLAVAIFAASLASRLFFWLATPDRAWGWTAWFKGDAPLWLEWARAIDLGTKFELGLPIHPPGTAYLAALLGNGATSGTGFLRFAWIFLGALVPLLVFLAAERSFGLRVAAVAGCWTALANGALVLSTSIDSETPYLVLAIGALWFTEDLRGRPKAGRVAAWSAANGLACLFRVEHVFFFLVALGFFALGWMRGGGLRPVRLAFAALVFFALPLVPWHLSAWAAIRRFNEEHRRLNPTEERAVSEVERQLAGLSWTADARAERDRLPAFLRRTASAFVLATVAYRGGREVRGADFEILDQAFGYRPRPLRRFPFVSSYGPLNFALANHARATGGFDRSLLEEAPPLGGGASSYPPFLVQGLPPRDLTFVYPPHLRLFNEGYSIGGKWILDHSGAFARLALRKLAIFWPGTASGLTGWNLPVGLSGLRRPVDMVVPDRGLTGRVWRIVILFGCLAGIVAGRRRAAIVPWLVFLLTRLAATVLFFGYARQGAAAIPVVGVLVGLAASATPIRIRAGSTAIPLLLLGVALDGARAVAKPELAIDGRRVTVSEPLHPDDHDVHRVEVRLR
jgi:hypothetical protein